MEISVSAEEGEASPPKCKKRALAQSDTLMEVDEALPEASEHVQPEDVQRAQQESLDQAQAEAADWTATLLPSQPAKPEAQVARDDSSSVFSTLQPDPNDIGSMDEMLRLMAAPPPWCHANPKRCVVIHL